MTAANDVFSALTEEAAELDRIVGALQPAQWELPTPATGWTIMHQIAHLAFVADLAGLAAGKPEVFAELAAGAKVDFQGSADAGLKQYLDGATPESIRARWQASQAAAGAALAAIPAGEVVPWLVNPLPPSILGAAGLTELFGHGQDVRDALGIQREFTDRIGHIVFFGARTRDFGYQAHGLTPPAEEFRFEITAPSGTLWAFGPEDSTQRVSGPAGDFCLLVTRRRHYTDLGMTATGEEASRWLTIAQAYRGPAGDGRKPGQFDGR